MKRQKSFREIMADMFTEPNNKNVSLILVIIAFACVYGTIMESIEFCFTHTFHLREYFTDLSILLTPIMGIYTTEKLGRKFMDQNPPKRSEDEKNNDQNSPSSQ